MTLDYSKRRRKAHLWGMTLRDARRFALIAVPLLLLGLWLEKTRFGEEVQVATYNLLQGHLAASPVPDSLQVIVVDISSIKPRVVDDGISQRLVTPRDEIERLLKNIAAHHPAAIGVDVDFSPQVQESTYQAPDDWKFFDEVIKLSEELRNATGDSARGIYLGVGRNIGDRDSWLGEAKYANLAGGIVVPFAENGPVIRSMPAYLQPVAECGSTHHETCGKLPSLAWAMVNGRQAQLKDMRQDFMVSQSEFERSSRGNESDDETAAKIVGEDYLVDFGAVDKLERETFPASGVTAAPDQDSIFRNRYVLLGDKDLSLVGDRLVVPGHAEQIKGVYAHASAIYTLVQRPLYALRPFVDIVIDVLLGALSLVVVGWLRFYFAKRGPENVSKDRVDALTTFAVILMLVGIGYFAVYRWRLVWIGYAIVIMMQLLHLVVDRTLPENSDKHDSQRSVWRRWFFEAPRE